MNICFHAPHGQVKEWVINYLRDQLMELHHKDKEITTAQVHFRQLANGAEHEKVCEIGLAIYGDAITIHRRADSFEQATREALKELIERIDNRVKNQNEPPDERTSTVSV